ncbi:hypothetical protein LIER_13660 [Lithospermum erythrorhizon]|uniref:Uncharacterized protein n=1 Tax=Lithospermum erythrorhizon TaxID=34254 RepID=A0AAV3PY89_LITER
MRTEMKGFCEDFSSKVEPDTWRPFFFYTSCEGLPQGAPFGFMAHPKSYSIFPCSAKHKVDAYAFSTFWEDKLPMPLYFYTDNRVLKAAGLFPIADADLRALSLNFSYNKSSEEDEAMSPLLRRYLSLPGLTSFLEPLFASMLTWAARHRPRPPAEPESSATDHSGPWHLSCGRLRSKLVHRYSGTGGSRWFCPRPSKLLKRSERTPPSSSPAASNHAELVSSISTLGDKVHLFPLPSFVFLCTPLIPLSFLQFFALHGVALQSYKELMSSYEAASGSSSQDGQLEGELKAFIKEKACKEGVLQCRLKKLASEHTTLQERYGASVRLTKAVRATLEGVQAEKDSTMRERDAAVKERDNLCAGKGEMLQTHDRLLDQLTESQCQAQVMEATLEGAQTADGLEELIRSSDAGRDLLFRHFSLALERTIRAVQARPEEAELEVPPTLRDSVRNDVSFRDPSNP